VELIIYPVLGQGSKRAIKRVKKRFGRFYFYTPQDRLVKRLSQELGMSEDKVREQIERERVYLIQYRKYY
jgi:hypothetical protein